MDEKIVASRLEETGPSKSIANKAYDAVKSLVSSPPDKTPADDSKDSLKLSIATPRILLDIIAKIEDNFQEDSIFQEEFVPEMELLFGVIDQYKFLFPFQSSRLYEVCVFKKLLMQVDEQHFGSTTFSYMSLITTVLRKQKHEFDQEFRDKVYKLLMSLVDDLQYWTGGDLDIFQNSLNLPYLHVVASQNGKNHLKQIEQLFQDEYPSQAMASIQTNHFLYVYLEMLHRIWSFVVDAEPICTWPAFNSTMQMHHDIQKNLETWRGKSLDIIKQKEGLAHTEQNTDDYVKEFIAILTYIDTEISEIIEHMKNKACLKYRGKRIRRIQINVMKLWYGRHTRKFLDSDDVLPVYIAYCVVKCNDNNDTTPEFKDSKEMLLTDDNVKKITQALLTPSAYPNYKEIYFPEEYINCMNDLFTVKTDGNVVLNQNPTCQQIINLTLANFGIILRPGSSVDDLEEQRKQVKSSLGIIPSLSDSESLIRHRRMPFQKTKFEGSWDITVDTESSLLIISTKELSLQDPLNMFFDDNVLELSQNEKMCLLIKFITSNFFEYRQTEELEFLSEEYVQENFNEFQQKRLGDRLDSCLRVIRDELNGEYKTELIPMYKKLYGGFDECDASLFLESEEGGSGTTSEESTEEKGNNDTSQGLMGYAKQIANSLAGLWQGSKASSEAPVSKEHENDNLQLQVANLEKQIDSFIHRSNTGNDVQKECSSIISSLNKLYADLQSKHQGILQKAFEIFNSPGYNSGNTEKVKLFHEARDKLKVIQAQMVKVLTMRSRFEEYFSSPQQSKTDEGSFLGSLLPKFRTWEIGIDDSEGSLNEREGEDVPVDGAQSRQENFSALPGDVRTNSETPGTQHNTPQPRGSAKKTGGNMFEVKLFNTPSDEEAGTAIIDETSQGKGDHNLRLSNMKTVPNPSNITNPNIDTTFTKSQPVAAGGLKTLVAVAPHGFGKIVKSEPGFLPQLVSAQSRASPSVLNVSSGIQSPQDVTTAPAGVPRQKASNGGNLLPIAPIEKIENFLHGFIIRNQFSIEEFKKLLNTRPIFKGIFPDDITEYPGLGKADKVYKQNIIGLGLYEHSKRETWEFLPAHAFLFVNSTKDIRKSAEHMLHLFIQGDTKEAWDDRQSFCSGQTFSDIRLPTWVNEDYLDKWREQLPIKDNKSIGIDVQYLESFPTWPIFQDPKKKLNDSPTKLKLRFLLYIALTKIGLLDIEKERLQQIAKQPTGQGMFTQPSVWCDNDTNESTWKNRPVCCRCGMCSAQPGVVQNTRNTDFLVYCTAPPTHPLLSTFRTQAAYSTQNRLPVFAAAPMQAMVPGTQTHQIYIWRP